VRKAAYAPPGERPGYFDHVRTIQYDGPRLNLNGKSVILFDDLLTRGDTSMACQKIIADATGCSRVIGIFLGRTLR
jgi:adenine/guanine phosphoribosyltransferase-like PRPP-binding protein